VVSPRFERSTFRCRKWSGFYSAEKHRQRIQICSNRLAIAHHRLDDCGPAAHVRIEDKVTRPGKILDRRTHEIWREARRVPIELMRETGHRTVVKSRFPQL